MGRSAKHHVARPAGRPHTPPLARTYTPPPGATAPPVAYRAGHPLIPDSHPLDFDWRFDESTIATLHDRVRSQNVLLLGVPTVARRIDASGGRALLVDRQPVQCVRHHLATEMATVSLDDGAFDVAIADPPWYPGQLVEWAEVAARAVRPGGEVLVSVWPRETRPGAESELAQCLGTLGRWADVSALPIELRYDTPPFEQVAGYISQSVGQTRSPRRGLLLRLVARERPAPPAMKPTAPRWHRFLFDRYQLAVRLGPRVAGDGLIVRHPEASDWLWPYVSARAPGIGDIGLWSSRGEVAQVRDPKRLIFVLQRARRASTLKGFEAAFARVPELLEWQIPRPPFHQVCEWQHR